ncbi:ATP-binding protein [Thermodesulfobacteriota bacterium]
MKQSTKSNNRFENLPLNMAIVGGGRACKSFLELLKDEPFSYLNITLVGVCDINPKAEGLQLAREMGIFTTNDFRDILKIEGLNGIVELTNSRKTLMDLIRLKPKGVGVLEHNISRFLEGLVRMERRLKSAEQQVALERKASDFVIQQANERIVVLNPDFSIVEANEPYLKVVSKSKNEVIGAHCYEITHGLNAPCSSSRPELGCPMTETLMTGKAAQVIHEHPSTGDLPTYCDMVTYPIKNQNGDIIRVIEVWRDITEALSYRWEKRVNELKDDFKKLIQEDRMISLGKLVASCVHEINNPIQGLLTFCDLMLNTIEEGKPEAYNPEEFRKYLSMMSKELERCGNIISGLLFFSRQSAMGLEKVNLNELLGEVIALTRHKMELQDIQLIIELSTELLMVKGDANQLQQCFLNLVFNAIESMPDGGRLSIISESDHDRGESKVQIKDTGCGIADENLEHMFDPFFTTKEEGEGTGLGLSIVHGIVKTHEGDIKVKSQLGEGSTFILTLPL